MTRHSSCILTLAIVCGMTGIAAPLAAQTDDTLTVAYTGRLLGYARLPDRQSKTTTGCSDQSGPTDGSDDVGKLLKERLETYKGALIVGMGDNFAPELDARRFADGDLKEMFTWDHVSGGPWIPNGPRLAPLVPSIEAGHTAIPTDNVACFFRLARYTALVPGKHDFYYGPERLRAFARFLATPLPGTPHTVQMLAGNLVIDTRDTTAAPRLPVAERNPHDRLGYALSDLTIKIDLPEVVLPSMREVTVRHAPAPLAAVICTGKAIDTPGVNDPDRFPSPALSLCQPLELIPQTARQKLADEAVFKLPAPTRLERDRNYGLCVSRGAATPQYVCAPFTVHAPFFEYQHGVAASAAPQRLPDPFVMTKIQIGKGLGDVAIFGVVDPELPEHIGALNDNWIHEPPHPEYETTIKTFDPKSALQQLMQSCWTRPECRTARKVLLAQMPPYKAQQLAARLARGWFTEGRADGNEGSDWFDLVVAQADEEAATGEETRTRVGPLSMTPRPNQPPKIRGRDWAPTTDHARAPFVIVPDPLHVITKSEIANDASCKALQTKDNDRCIRVTVQKADVSSMPKPAEAVTYKLVHASEARLAILATPVGSKVTLEASARETLARLLEVPVSAMSSLKSAEVLQRLALAAMRKDQDGNADVALIQRRDLFEADWHAVQAVDPATLQSILDRVFWKGDYATHIFVTGAALKDALKKADQFDANDASSLSVEAETLRGFVSLGVARDATTKEYFVNGEAIDDSRLYGLAVTDYIGMGDTGYPELLAKAPVAPDRVVQLKRLSRIATMLCERISAAVPALQTAACHVADPAAANDVRWQLDAANQQPADTTHGLWAPRRLFRWFVPPPARQPIANRPGQNPTERIVQDREVWKVILDSAQLGYSRTTRDRTPDEVKDQFPGVHEPRVTSADVKSFSYAYQIQTVRTGHLVDRFVNSNLTYSRDLNQQKNGSFQTNQRTNAVSSDAGYRFHIWPVGKQVAGLTAFASGRVESQPVSPSVVVNDVEFTTRRSTFLAGRLGFRLAGDQRWIEAGWQAGRRLHSAFAYKSGDATCDIAAGDDKLKACFQKNAITTSKDIETLVRDRYEEGYFFNLHAVLPLRTSNKLALIVDNTAQYFVPTPDDTAVDTRTSENFVVSLRFPIFGSLSAVPKFDWLLFENKGQPFRTIHSTKISVVADWHFDWHQGISWNRAMRYANPAPTQ